MQKLVFAAAMAAAMAATSSTAFAQLQERPNLPVEKYAGVVLWHYGENRPERLAEGCLRWGAHTRTWYDVCKNRRAIRVRY